MEAAAGKNLIKNLPKTCSTNNCQLKYLMNEL